MGKNGGPYCGGKLRHRPGTCERAAGAGTSHKGFGRCSWHGGTAPSGVKAAENQRAEHEARRALEGIGDFQAIDNPVERLQLLAGRAQKWMEICGAKAAELTSLRYEDRAGEQLRAEVAMYERSMTYANRILVDLAKLNLDERQVRISERTASLVNGVLLGALADIGLDGELRELARVAIGRRLRLVAAGEPAGVRAAIGPVPS